MKNILVTGGSGQLASCIKDLSAKIEDFNFIYVDIDELDITDINAVKAFFKNNSVSYCINCAAYTAVDKAESNKEAAERVNVLGAINLAKACKANDAFLIHISTDFVFDGMQTSLYEEQDKANPLSVYGLTKLNAELAIADVLMEHIIIRTSWLYSEHGNNFLKTMLKLGTERDSLNVVTDQIGTPTYAGDLAKTIMTIIEKEKPKYGTYHYSNEGAASWYDFAKAIFDISGVKVMLSPIKTEAYPTPAVRPSYSVMDKSKIKEELKITIPYWRDSLRVCLKRLEENVIDIN
ncbi:dTDP-4-dehydrorhamnose reductase [Maribacter sp. ACAM166]|uniref:dTDP-4-dehydrorhamnose reductase n=1 Tax=Maribacter sp. ACAM166 TaxID=2508996 RepID=UPI0010FECAFB|nr:dTDP-4-dehydrorhamnose reductase [Maribacter sp. ACAM166]TLP80748.1 dTDP-4-dehydrorhamnose reductase [Maribacter sp. ACAM166]